MDLATIILNLRGLADWIEKYPQRPLPGASWHAQLIRLAASQLETAKAAPDMLKALKQIAEYSPASTVQPVSIARAAIAKATGEPQS